ncbi:hypothetical protein LIA77_10479 [Sarocladium implicatum]|nr:hypothetical protein LIA77_10479 [Sarocladium implicatum]
MVLCTPEVFFATSCLQPNETYLYTQAQSPRPETSQLLKTCGLRTLKLAFADMSMRFSASVDSLERRSTGYAAEGGWAGMLCEQDGSIWGIYMGRSSSRVDAITLIRGRLNGILSFK